jgi:hypothetical protein
LPIFFFLFFLKTSRKEKPLWIILCYVSLNILISFSDPYTQSSPLLKIITYAFSTFYEYSLFTYFIWINIKSKKFRKFIAFASILFVIFLLIFYTNVKFIRLDSVPIGVESILILIFASYFFYEQVNNPQVLFIYNDYKFWIITAMMIFLSGSFFIYIFVNQIPKSELSQYWSFIQIFFLLMYILFSIGIIILGLKPNQKHHTKPKPNYHYLDIT